ncbi:glucokinase [Theileria orientalis]|uniref:Phosphotransferase n=1 Tax=Theileria orientalis TaxID=68886 RepID=A0A976QU94_THEOR|nr:glucokinase [Theileria orientalis]
MSNLGSFVRENLVSYHGEPVSHTTLSFDPNVRLNQIIKQLSVSLDELAHMSMNFYSELVNGPKAHKRHRNLWLPEECSFKMLDSFISHFPTGNEKGSYYALDFGGSNFRAVRILIDGSGKMHRNQSTFSLRYSSALGPKGLLDQKATATELFDHFATKIGQVIRESGDDPEPSVPYNVGFTFSFPCTMLSHSNAILLDWTKDFETGRATNDQVEGKDVGVLMDEAFARNKINAKVSIILNDTVGTLLCCAYQKPKDYPPCKIGVILGTGFNICYEEDEYDRFGYVGRVINIECGNFDKELPFTPVDYEIDYYTSNRGRGKLEKLVSGAYLGEIIRRYMILYLADKASSRMWEPGTFSSEDASLILNDETEDLNVTKEVTFRSWNVRLPKHTLIGLRKICEAVFSRSAGFAAASICATARKAKAFVTSKASVAVDGSLYIKNEWYRNKLQYYIDNVTTPDIRGGSFISNMYYKNEQSYFKPLMANTEYIKSYLHKVLDPRNIQKNGFIYNDLDTEHTISSQHISRIINLENDNSVPKINLEITRTQPRFKKLENLIRESDFWKTVSFDHKSSINPFPHVNEGASLIMNLPIHEILHTRSNHRLSRRAHPKWYVAKYRKFMKKKLLKEKLSQLHLESTND